LSRKAAVRTHQATGVSSLMELSMNVLEIIRRQVTREERLQNARKVSLCYRGISYERKS